MADFRLVARLLEVIETDILPMTASGVARGDKIFGAAILRKEDRSLVLAETNAETENPLWHGEVHCLKRFYEMPKAERVDTKDAIFLATHEPCSLCLSAITWTGFDNFFYLFSHEDSRDSFAIPHDLKILKEVFTLDPGGYRAENAYWKSYSIGKQLRVTAGYQAPPLDGVWATAPYFHNGSVPTLAGVLNSKSRPKLYTRSFKTDEADYDKEKVGWKVTGDRSLSCEPATGNGVEIEPLGQVEVRLFFTLDGPEEIKANAAALKVTGKLLSQANWTTEEHFGPEFVTDAQEEMAAADEAAATATNKMPLAAPAPNSYLVYPFPARDPDDSPRSLVTAPADAQASPFGWHDTNGAAGAEYTTARGNNAHAYADLVDPDGFSAGDVFLTCAQFFQPQGIAQFIALGVCYLRHAPESIQIQQADRLATGKPLGPHKILVGAFGIRLCGGQTVACLFDFFGARAIA